MGWLAIVAVVACQPSPAPTATVPPQGLAAGIEFLLRAQSPDGAWRSDTYGTFKDGTALTPLVAFALQEAGIASRRGSEFLAKMARPDGTIDEGEFGLDFPAYTAALSVIVLSHPANADLQSARQAWLNYLLARQLTEPLGWQTADKEYGGWGYCRTIPRKPVPNQIAAPLIESNLSATVFALDALAAAGHVDPEPAARARRFVARCQNPDGGFHFIYDDPVRNKAGGAGNRFHSYGSATADGFRALASGDPARQAAARWLQLHADPERHPGAYIPTHERNREAVYFYYAAALARYARITGDTPLANRLATALLSRQQPDGSWSNPVDAVRENDAILATAWATLALANCSQTSK